GLAALDKLAVRKHGAPFADCVVPEQFAVLAALQKGSRHEKEFFETLLALAVEAYASHPAVWSEMGYGGPAYPRGYYRIEAGAAGGVLAHRLARAGLDVVVIEAGPFWDPETDFASDELSMQRLGWQQTRLVAGDDPLKLGHNNSGRGVGGGTTHFTGVFLRFH